MRLSVKPIESGELGFLRRSMNDEQMELCGFPSPLGADYFASQRMDSLWLWRLSAYLRRFSVI
jgi:hypothetical protein